jgi:RNA polymerase sigma-70 factor (ECF subfamily)
MGRISITQVSRWARRREPATSVDPARFQGDGEPYPRHWREFPPEWPPVDPGTAEVAQVLAAALDELPPTWRSIVAARDQRGETASEVAAQYKVSEAEQRAILNKARASLRRALAEHFGEGRP